MIDAEINNLTVTGVLPLTLPTDFGGVSESLQVAEAQTVTVTKSHLGSHPYQRCKDQQSYSN